LLPQPSWNSHASRIIQASGEWQKIAIARAYGIFGSIDMNRGDPRNGWDTDQFPNNAQELVPGRVGMISGLFFGFAFGMGGIGAAVLGKLADATSVVYVYKVCAYLPAIGLLTGFLPNLERKRIGA